MELNLNDLEQVTGGIGSGYSDSNAYCRTCGQRMKYLGQTRIEGENTGEFQCENTNFNGTGTNCPEFHVVKYNTDVNFAE